MHESMKCTYHLVISLLLLAIELGSGAKKSLHPAITVCKRADPDIRACYCRNAKTIIPIIKSGVPEMNIPATDPIVVDNITIDFGESQSVRLVAGLNNVTLRGLSDMQADKCNFRIVETGVDIHLDFKIPVLQMNSLYRATGSVLLLPLNTTGDFNGEFTGLVLNSTWTSSKYMKNGKEYLKMHSSLDNLTIGHINMYFHNLLGINKEIDERVNAALAENIDALYNEVKPIILETIESVVGNIVNRVYDTFPFDVLYPIE